MSPSKPPSHELTCPRCRRPGVRITKAGCWFAHYPIARGASRCPMSEAPVPADVLAAAATHGAWVQARGNVLVRRSSLRYTTGHLPALITSTEAELVRLRQQQTQAEKDLAALDAEVEALPPEPPHPEAVLRQVGQALPPSPEGP